MNASLNGGKYAIRPNQIRAARALLGWSREQLSLSCNVPIRTLDRLEKGDGEPQQRTLVAVSQALETAGVEFIEENGGGPGVRLRTTNHAWSTDV